MRENHALYETFCHSKHDLCHYGALGGSIEFLNGIAVRHALEILQKIGRGTNRVRHLVTPQDFCLFGKEGPMRLEIEVKISARVFAYEIAFDFPPLFKEMRIVEEKLQVDSTPVYTRELAQVEVHKDARNDAASFRLDWHLAALPISQDRGKEDPLKIFKLWLSRPLILNIFKVRHHVFKIAVNRGVSRWRELQQTREPSAKIT